MGRRPPRRAISRVDEIARAIRLTRRDFGDTSHRVPLVGRARPFKRLIQKEIVNQLSKRILAGDIDKTHPVLVDVFDNTVVFRNENPVESKRKEKKATS